MIEGEGRAGEGEGRGGREEGEGDLIPFHAQIEVRLRHQVSEEKKNFKSLLPCARFQGKLDVLTNRKK